VTLPPLAEGTYLVSWQVLSTVDGHTTSGIFPFGVGVEEVAGDVGSISSTAQEPTIFSIGGRWLSLTGVALLLGLFAFYLFVWQPLLVTGGPHPGPLSGDGVKLSPPDPPKGGEKTQIPPSGGLGGPEPATILTTMAYQDVWLNLEKQAQQLLPRFFADRPFSEFVAVYEIMRRLPGGSRLQLGNSMPVRYASYIGLGPAVGAANIRVNANRGTSGIDGSLSTTVGAALATTEITTLISGDLAFFYDRNGLWHQHIPPNLRVVILNNHGGGIFKLDPLQTAKHFGVAETLIKPIDRDILLASVRATLEGQR